MFRAAPSTTKSGTKSKQLSNPCGTRSARTLLSAKRKQRPSESHGNDEETRHSQQKSADLGLPAFHPFRSQALRQEHRPARYLARNRRRRVPHHPGRKRLRKNYAAADSSRLRAIHRGRSLDVGRAPRYAASLSPPREHSLSELCPLPAHDRRTKRWLRISRRQTPCGRDSIARGGSAGQSQNVSLREIQAFKDQRRTTAAHSACRGPW